MKELEVKIDFLKKIKPKIFLLGFKSLYLSEKARPGQFIHLKIDSPHIFFRRPFSIHRIKGRTVYILFKVRGKGTSLLSGYKQGAVLDLIGPLGNGFGVSLKKASHNTIVGGGIGTAPLLFLAERLKGKDTSVFLGAGDKSEIVCAGEFKELGCKVFISTEDGSLGVKGRVTDLLKSYLRTTSRGLRTDIYACGPKAMFKSLAGIIRNKPGITCQASFEQVMGCGIGICSACVIRTKKGYKKVCKDGPVFDLKEIY